MAVTIEPKQNMIGTSIFCVFLNKPSHYQQSCPIVLLSIDKCSKIHFNYTVLSLYLAIGLGVKGFK